MGMSFILQVFINQSIGHIEIMMPLGEQLRDQQYYRNAS